MRQCAKNCAHIKLLLVNVCRYITHLCPLTLLLWAVDKVLREGEREREREGERQRERQRQKKHAASVAETIILNFYEKEGR